MSESDIKTSHFEDFYISEATTSTRHITRCRDAWIRLIGPAEVEALLRERIEEIELRGRCSDDDRTITDIFIIFIISDISATVFVAIICVGITIIVSKLIGILTISLWSSSVVCCANSCSITIICYETSTTSDFARWTRTSAIIVSISIGGCTDISTTSIVSKSCRGRVMSGRCGGADGLPIPVFFIVDDSSLLYLSCEFL
jgi:hypothetical protein